MSHEYKLVDEITSECDWELYDISYGEVCIKGATKALIDTTHTSDPDEYPEGDHIAHLCDDHGERVLLRLNELITGTGGW